MSERAEYYPLSDLSPAEALDILAETAATHGSEGLELVTVQLRPLESRVTVTLIVPERNTLRGSKRQIEVRWQTLAALIDGYWRRMGLGGPPNLARGNVTGALPLREGAARLLLHPEGEAARPDESEWMLVARGARLERAVEILATVSFDATARQVSVPTGVTADDGGEETVYLFHVLDDHGRASLFRSDLPAGFFSDCAQLVSFPSDGAEVFLPPQASTGRQVLAAFCRLVQHAPGLFSVGRALQLGATPAGPERHQKLAAIYYWPPDGGESTVFVSYLLGLNFSDRLGPPGIAAQGYVVSDLRESEANLRALRDAVDQAKPRVGYRLELRRSAYLETPEEEEVRKLREQLVDLEFQLAAAQNVAGDRPLLYRFSPRQLPALADVLRTYPIRVLREKRIQYGFQAVHSPSGVDASKDEGAGLHYLYLDPRIVGGAAEAEAPLLWRQLDELTVRFWLDPYWSRYYYGDGNECLVFVPYGLALFPPMHAWEPDKMDSYLREIMGRWFHGGGPAPNLPGRAMYVFDGQPRPDATIHISVLDQDAFVDLDTQLGWLNSNLDILHPQEEVRELIDQIAAARTRRAAADEAMSRAAEAEVALDRAASAAASRIRSTLDDLLNALTAELRDLVKNSQQTTEEVVRLKERLAALAAVGADMRELSRQFDEARAEVESEARRSQTEYDQLLKTLGALAQWRVKIEAEVSQEIDRLVAARRRLEDRLRWM